MKVLVIIATFNAEKWLDFCLSSIINKENIEIICIDNNSSDNTASILKKDYPSVLLIENQENLGFGRANNIGLKYFLNHKYDYAFLLNQDACLEPNSIEKLTNLLYKYPDYGIISPVHRAQEPNKLDLNFAQCLSAIYTPTLIDDLLLSNPLKEIYQTKFVNAALWCMSRKCISEVGMFDPIFPHYGEDNDYCIRALEKNHKIGIAPSVLASHVRSNSGSEVKKKDFGSEQARYYIDLIVRYKKIKANPTKLYLIIIRDFICEIFNSAMHLKFKEIIYAAKGYSKTIFNFNPNERKKY